MPLFPGLAALPAFIGENPMNIVHAITCVIAFVATFIIAYLIDLTILLMNQSKRQ